MWRTNSSWIQIFTRLKIFASHDWPFKINRTQFYFESAMVSGEKSWKSFTGKEVWLLFAKVKIVKDSRNWKLYYINDINLWWFCKLYNNLHSGERASTHQKDTKKTLSIVRRIFWNSCQLTKVLTGIQDRRKENKSMSWSNLR